MTGRPKSENPKKYQIFIRIDEDLKNKIDEKRGALTPSSFVRQAVYEKVYN